MLARHQAAPLRTEVSKWFIRSHRGGRTLQLIASCKGGQQRTADSQRHAKGNAWFHGACAVASVFLVATVSWKSAALTKGSEELWLTSSMAWVSTFSATNFS